MPTNPAGSAARPSIEDEYFLTNPAPDNLHSNAELATGFISKHSIAGRPLVLVTSGGTTVPLENQTVRFIDNFSAGTRGATSAECFLDAGYAVIFLHRRFSLLPYSRHYSHSTNCFLDFMDLDENGTVTVKDEYQPSMKAVLEKWKTVKQNGTLLLMPYVSVGDYLWSLREMSCLLRPLGPSALFYLAAAVSDFFIPKHKLAEHKIQSTNMDKKTETSEDASGGDDHQTTPVKHNRLVIDLDPVPKFLTSLVDGWAPEGMVVSFKLETDPDLLLYKAQTALERYSHHLVIGNLLSTRAWEVLFVMPNEKERWIRVPVHQRAGSSGGGSLLEIETLIVPAVAELHKKLIHESAAGA